MVMIIAKIDMILSIKLKITQSMQSIETLKESLG